MTQQRRWTGIGVVLMTVALGVGLLSAGVGAAPIPPTPPGSYGTSEFTVPTIPPSTTTTTLATTTTTVVPTTTTTNPFPDALSGGPQAGAPTPTPNAPVPGATPPTTRCRPTLAVRRAQLRILQALQRQYRAELAALRSSRASREQIRALQLKFRRELLELRASCFLPGSNGQITLLSAPFNAGPFTVDAAGDVSTSVELPLGFEVGGHTATLTGIGLDGNPATASVAFTVVDESGDVAGAVAAAPGDLPRTGPGNTSGMLRVALLALGLGLALMLLRPSGGHYRRAVAS